MLDPTNNLLGPPRRNDEDEMRVDIVMDNEKGSDSASETEASHSLPVTAEEDTATPVGNHQGSSSPSPRKHYYLLCIGLGLVAILAAVVVPSVVLAAQKSNSNSSSSSSKAVSSTSSSDGRENDLSSSSLATSASSDTYDVEYTPEDNDQCLGHQTDGEFYEVSSIYFLDSLWGDQNQIEARTFDVDPSHTVLEDGMGVVFNVETVDPATEEDINKYILTNAEVTEQIMLEASRFYEDHAAEASNVTLEVVSNNDDVDLPLVFAGSQGFLAACMMSFAQHLPLALSAPQLWAVITQGFARHVDQHAESLRHLFVDHDGKKEIRIREDSLTLSSVTPQQWEQLVLPKFSQAISENMNNTDAYDTLVGEFSTTTPTSQAVSEIVLMAAMKNFFEYTLMTACGIPKIRLEGTRGDWVSLRDRTARLAQWMMPGHSHGELWIEDIVVPILDQFIDAYDGNVNFCFWQTMIKFRRTGQGSGSYDFLSGWLPTLFPYLSKAGGRVEPNPFLRKWEESATSLQLGPQPNEIPQQLSSVPVRWEYFAEVFPLHFHAGFRGVTQEADGTLAPALGWYVTHDPKDEQDKDNGKGE